MAFKFLGQITKMISQILSYRWRTRPYFSAIQNLGILLKDFQNQSIFQQFICEKLKNIIIPGYSFHIILLLSDLNQILKSFPHMPKFCMLK